MKAAETYQQQALQPGDYIDSDHAEIRKFAASQAVGATHQERAVALYYAVRDQIYYDPYSIRMEPETMRASNILAQGRGHCVAKAVMYAAVCRAAGIPARLGFADVKNHLTTPRLRELMQTDIFHYHGYSEVWLNGRWVKATPAFNLSLCERFGVLPLDFDGVNDSIFHSCDREGRQHMEYLVDHGPRLDLPWDELAETYREYYPVIALAEQGIGGDFAAEAASEINKAH